MGFFFLSVEHLRICPNSCYESWAYQETVCLVSLDRQKSPVSISLTHLSPAADWQEFGTLIKFRSLSRSSLYTHTKRRTHNTNQAPLDVVKKKKNSVLQRWHCQSLGPVSKCAQNITANLCQLACCTSSHRCSLSLSSLSSCFLLVPAAQTQVQMSSWQLLAASLWVYFLSPGGRLFRSNHHTPQMVSILSGGLWAH